jgi:adenylate kinase family enzyme
MSNPAIHTWITSDAPEASRLWLHGNPGTGKSVLSAFLIEQIQMNHDFQDQILLPYFCKAAGSEKCKSVHVLMAFLRQCLARPDHPYDMQVAIQLAQKLLGEREDYKFLLEEMEPYSLLFLGKFTKIW